MYAAQILEPVLATASLYSPAPLRLMLVRGRSAVLAQQSLLVRLAERTGQLGAFDYLGYILDGPYVGSKIPTLALVYGRETPDPLGAVFLFEYRTAGLPTGVFMTDDEAGEHTVVASPDLRPLVAATVADHLLRDGAHLLHLTVRTDPTGLTQALHGTSTTDTPPLWALRERVYCNVLPLAPTYDLTLAPMGKHTRRNLRYYERRAQTELGATLVSAPQLTEAEFLTLNHRFPYAVPDRVARWRFRNVHDLPGGFMVGLRANAPAGQLLPNGQAVPADLAGGAWLSLLGGRRHHRTTEITWQMNHSELDGFSFTNAMRSLLLRHEIALGTERLVFEGGTPHSIHSAFLPEPVLDLVCARRAATSLLLQKLARRVLPGANALRALLRDPSLEWHHAIT